MAKVPQAFIDDVLERTDIVDIISTRVRLKKTGVNYSGLCPFHQEKTPSFSLNPDKQFYYCFGCGSGGNALSFLMDFDRLSFLEAVEYLAKQLGLEIPLEHNPQQEKQQALKRTLYDVLKNASDFYQQQLQHHPDKEKALHYVKQRGLSEAVCQQFGIGFAPPGWDNLIRHITPQNIPLAMLQETGMVIEKENQSGFYDRFRDRLMFPIVDNRGRTIGFGGRVFNDDKPKYLNSPETPVFHKHLELYGLWQARQANRHLQNLIMVEGYMDVVALAQFAITNAVATLGTAAGTSHLEKAFRHTSEIIFCFDGDEAGRKAAQRALEAALPLMQAGRQLRFCFLPEGEDPDSWVRTLGKEKFIWQLEQSASLSEHLFSLCEQQLDLRKPDDKAVFISRVMPYIEQLPDTAFKTLILQSVADKVGLAVEKIIELESTQPPEKTSIAQHAQAVTPAVQRPKLDNTERRIIRSSARVASALLLFFPAFAQLTPDLQKTPLPEDNDCYLLKQLHLFLLENPTANAAQTLAHWLHKENANIKPLLQITMEHHEHARLKEEYLDAIAKIQWQYQQSLQRQQIVHFKDKKPLALSEDERNAFAALFKRPDKEQ